MYILLSKFQVILDCGYVRNFKTRKSSSNIAKVACNYNITGQLQSKVEKDKNVFLIFLVKVPFITAFYKLI